MDAFDLARKRRDQKLKRLEEVVAACACEWPVVRCRNLHGHGRTKDGQQCPATAVIMRHMEEDQG